MATDETQAPIDIHKILFATDFKAASRKVFRYAKHNTLQQKTKRELEGSRPCSG